MALTLIPQDSSDLLAEVYNDLGLAYFKLADLETAMSDFKLAVRLNNKNDRAYFNLGCTCVRNGNNFAAINNFTQVIQLNPKSANAYVNRGVAYHRLGYESAAIANLRKAASLFDNSDERLAYQQTFNLLKAIQQQIISQTTSRVETRGTSRLYF
ncbi:MAG: tetratricopeptide repeat protein [Calothrix sp. SM1_7_51]|nr:tetratricopeptide repeat protein [Calothrix sp. SM1_7_51]